MTSAALCWVTPGSEALRCPKQAWADAGPTRQQAAIASVLPGRTGRWDLLDRDASATHVQRDSPWWSLTCVSEASARKESVLALAREIRRNAAQPGSRVDRVRTRVRQHHDHVASVAVHVDVSGHVAYPYVAGVVANHQPRVARHQNLVFNRHAAPVVPPFTPAFVCGTRAWRLVRGPRGGRYRKGFLGPAGGVEPPIFFPGPLR